MIDVRAVVTVRCSIRCDGVVAPVCRLAANAVVLVHVLVHVAALVAHGGLVDVCVGRADVARPAIGTPSALGSPSHLTSSEHALIARFARQWIVYESGLVAVALDPLTGDTVA